jgi:hypothetical protein
MNVFLSYSLIALFASALVFRCLTWRSGYPMSDRLFYSLGALGIACGLFACLLLWMMA